MNLLSRLRALRREESGQSIVLLAVMLIMLLGFAGFVLDVGRALYTYRELQATTDAAATAGAAELPKSDAASVATTYSAVSGNLNARSSMSGVTMVAGYPKILCLNTLKNNGMACTAPGNGNAVQVRQQIVLPMTFMKLLGKSSLTLAAVATASSKGSQRAPYNVAIIVDTTGSMGSTDSDSNCNNTRISCALAGIQVLLQNLTPCAPSLTTCGAATNGNVSQPYDRVALYTFPSLYSQADVQHEYDCSGTTPQVNYYTDPYFAPTGSISNPSIYQIVPYSTDYKTTPKGTTLNTSSNLVKAVGGVSGCGMKAINMYTYIAGVMYKAGSDLINEDQAYPNSEGVVIILTDGDMNTPGKYMPYASTTSGSYASTINQCAQAINLAGYASTYNVKVYSIAYGATASGCSTDSSGVTPCQTVQQLASSPDYFYSDYTATGGSSACISAAHSTTALNTIFAQIATNLSSSRLIPDNTT